MAHQSMIVCLAAILFGWSIVVNGQLVSESANEFREVFLTPTVARRLIQCLGSNLNASPVVFEDLFRVIPRKKGWTHESARLFQTSLVSSLIHLIAEDESIDSAIMTQILTDCLERVAGVNGRAYGEKLNFLMRRFLTRDGKNTMSAGPESDQVSDSLAISSSNLGPSRSSASAIASTMTPGRPSVLAEEISSTEEDWRMESGSSQSTLALSRRDPGIRDRADKNASPAMGQAYRINLSRRNRVKNRRNNDSNDRRSRDWLQEPTSKDLYEVPSKQNPEGSDYTPDFGTSSSKANSNYEGLKKRLNSSASRTAFSSSKSSYSKNGPDVKTIDEYLYEEPDTAYERTPPKDPESENTKLKDKESEGVEIDNPESTDLLNKEYSRSQSRTPNISSQSSARSGVAKTVSSSGSSISAVQRSTDDSKQPITAKSVANVKTQSASVIGDNVSKQNNISLEPSSKRIQTNNVVNMFELPSSEVKDMSDNNSSTSSNSLTQMDSSNISSKSSSSSNGYSGSKSISSDTSTSNENTEDATFENGSTGTGNLSSLPPDFKSTFISIFEEAMGTSSFLQSSLEKLKSQPLNASDFYNLIFNSAQWAGVLNAREVAEVLSQKNAKTNVLSLSRYLRVSAVAVADMLISRNFLTSENVRAMSRLYMNRIVLALQMENVENQREFYQNLAVVNQQYLSLLGVLQSEMIEFSQYFGKEILLASASTETNENSSIQKLSDILRKKNSFEEIGFISSSESVTKNEILETSASTDSPADALSLVSSNIVSQKNEGITLYGGENLPDSLMKPVDDFNDDEIDYSFVAESNESNVVQFFSSAVSSSVLQIFSALESYQIISNTNISTSLASKTLLKVFERNSERLKLSNVESILKIITTFFKGSFQNLTFPSLVTLLGKSLGNVLSQNKLLTWENYKDISETFENCILQQIDVLKSLTDITSYIYSLMDGTICFLSFQNIASENDFLNLATGFNSQYTSLQNASVSNVEASARSYSNSTSEQEISIEDDLTSSYSKTTIESFESYFKSSLSEIIYSSSQLSEMIRSHTDLSTVSDAFRTSLANHLDSLDLAEPDSIADEITSSAFRDFPVDPVPLIPLVQSSAFALARHLSRMGLLTEEVSEQLSTTYLSSALEEASPPPEAIFDALFGIMGTFGGTQDLLRFACIFNCEWRRRTSSDFGRLLPNALLPGGAASRISDMTSFVASALALTEGRMDAVILLRAVLELATRVARSAPELPFHVVLVEALLEGNLALLRVVNAARGKFVDFYRSGDITVALAKGLRNWMRD